MNALLLNTVLLVTPTTDPLKESGVQCTVSAVGCVYGSLGKFDVSTGLVCDIATLGTPTTGKCKYRIELFVGVDVKEKIIFLGKAGAKAGLNITCDVEMQKGPMDKAVVLFSLAATSR